MNNKYKIGDEVYVVVNDSETCRPECGQEFFDIANIAVKFTLMKVTYYNPISKTYSLENAKIRHCHESVDGLPENFIYEKVWVDIMFKSSNKDVNIAPLLVKFSK